MLQKRREEMKNQEMEKFYKQARANVIYMYDEVRKQVKEVRIFVNFK